MSLEADGNGNDAYFPPIKHFPSASRYDSSPYLGRNGGCHYRHVANESMMNPEELEDGESMNINGNNLYDYRVSNKKKVFDDWKNTNLNFDTKKREDSVPNSAQNLIADVNGKQKLRKTKSVQRCVFWGWREFDDNFIYLHW